MLRQRLYFCFNFHAFPNPWLLDRINYDNSHQILSTTPYSLRARGEEKKIVTRLSLTVHIHLNGYSSRGGLSQESTKLMCHWNWVYGIVVHTEICWKTSVSNLSFCLFGWTWDFKIWYTIPHHWSKKNKNKIKITRSRHMMGTRGEDHTQPNRNAYSKIK